MKYFLKTENCRLKLQTKHSLKSEKKDTNKNTLTERKKERVVDLKRKKKTKDTNTHQERERRRESRIWKQRSIRKIQSINTTHKPRERERKKRQL